jgi:hypothetical protein
MSLADVEVLVNDHIKGWFFLVKELSASFKTRGKGTLSLVYPDVSSRWGAGTGRDTPVELLGAAALAAFRSFAIGLLSAASADLFITQGFTCSETGDGASIDAAGFAAFVFKQLDEGSRRHNGKLHKYGKLGLFK